MRKLTLALYFLGFIHTPAEALVKDTILVTSCTGAKAIENVVHEVSRGGFLLGNMYNTIQKISEKHGCLIVGFTSDSFDEPKTQELSVGGSEVVVYLFPRHEGEWRYVIPADVLFDLYRRGTLNRA